MGLPAGISTELGSFILNHIESVGQLEVLLLLAADPSRRWSPESVRGELRSSASSAEHYLYTLHQRQLLKLNEDNTYSFAPKNPDLEQIVGQLKDAYKLRHVAVIHLIYDRSTEVIQSLADAFKLRKD